MKKLNIYDYVRNYFYKYYDSIYQLEKSIELEKEFFNKYYNIRPMYLELNENIYTYLLKRFGLTIICRLSDILNLVIEQSNKIETFKLY